VAFSICYVTAELAPHAKAGGLGDVSAALTQRLHEHGHEVTPFLPLYANLDRHGLALQRVDALQDLEMAFGPDRYRYSVLRARRGDALPDLLLVDCPALFDRPGLYGSGPDEHLRFLLLSRAALEACGPLGVRPDIVHCHDWHTALLPLYLKTAYAGDPALAGARSVLTIHNLGYQGVIDHAEAPRLGLGAGVARLDAREAAEGRINLLGQGLIDADVVSTVSPTYAREICTPGMGMGLDGVLRERGDEVVGILNGVDIDAWDPARDPWLPHRYSRADLAGKTRMRTALCNRLGLDPDPARPVVGMVTRLVWQKGVDLLFDVLPAALASGELSLAVLGSGDPAYEAALRRLAADHPGLVAFRGGHDEELAHWIEAGADAFLMPSRYEPCGLNQMYSMRYGTVPLVRRTGGLADSVQHFDPATGEGTGIVFNEADGGAVRWALGRMRELFADRPAWRRMMQNGMARDFSWDGPVERYLELYDRAAALRR
jgi:starch synthase